MQSSYNLSRILGSGNVLSSLSWNDCTVNEVKKNSFNSFLTLSMRSLYYKVQPSYCNLIYVRHMPFNVVVVLFASSCRFAEGFPTASSWVICNKNCQVLVKNLNFVAGMTRCFVSAKFAGLRKVSDESLGQEWAGRLGTSNCDCFQVVPSAIASSMVSLCIRLQMFSLCWEIFDKLSIAN